MTPMSQSRASIESELRVSVRPAIALLVAFGAVAGLVSNHVPSAGVPERVLVLVLFAISAIAMLLNNWRVWAGKWFFLVGLSAVVMPLVRTALRFTSLPLD